MNHGGINSLDIRHAQIPFINETGAAGAPQTVWPTLPSRIRILLQLLVKIGDPLLARDPAHGRANDPVHGLAKDSAHDLAKDPVHGLAKDPVQCLAKDPVHGLTKDPVHGSS